MRRKLAAGNWKMNGTAAALAEVEALIAGLSAPECEVLLCPPATLIARMAEVAKGSALKVGGQDCHAEASGAHTGDISAGMLADAGASHVILGHSERRADHGETDSAVRAKAEAAQAAGLVALICVGETEAERDAGRELDVIGAQLAGSVPDTANGADTVIAYEPVWAIGSGRTPTEEQIAAVHRFLRDALEARFGESGSSFRLLYGGSVKPANAAQIFAIPDVDGALVGGASLKATDFGAIISALRG
jgi:triosephosphate isomerase (TIM)